MRRILMAAALLGMQAAGSAEAQNFRSGSLNRQNPQPTRSIGPGNAAGLFGFDSFTNSSAFTPFGPTFNGFSTIRRTPRVFNPTTGTFVPSPVGAFVGMNNGFAPSAFGFNRFNPWQNGTWAYYWGLQNGAMFNPYLANGYGSNAYALPNPYAAPYSAYSTPYMSGYNGAAYGSSNGYASPSGYSTPSTASPQVAVNSASYSNGQNGGQQASTLTALGIPTENGEIAWPLAFRMMSPQDRRDLRDPAEEELRYVAIRVAGDSVNSRIMKDAAERVGGLRRWLQSRRPNLAEGKYREGDQFLRRIEQTLSAY